ncbi:hypothetical protein, partial [Deinococcus marmoris]|uniref:hypothetical protein n=1 Tax=Deinococcus marmoris TaxID=249408 RepID=UPI0039EE5CCA
FKLVKASLKDQAIGAKSVLDAPTLSDSTPQVPLLSSYLDIRCTVSPNPINIDSFSEVRCTLKVEIYPPLDEVIPINLGSPGAGHSIATSCETLETTLEDGVLKADVVFTFGELPEFFFEEGYTSGNGYIVNVGDAFGYRKQFYWTTLVNINFNPTKQG